MRLLFVASWLFAATMLTLGKMADHQVRASLDLLSANTAVPDPFPPPPPPKKGCTCAGCPCIHGLPCDCEFCGCVMNAGQCPNDECQKGCR